MQSITYRVDSIPWRQDLTAPLRVADATPDCVR